MIFADTDLSAFKSAMSRGEHVLLSTHVHPDADAIGSVLAVQEMIARLGASSTVILEDGCPPRYGFLPGAPEIVNYRTIAQSEKKYNTAVVVDSGGLDRIGDVQNLLSDGAWIANIDHHITNDGFGKVNWVHVECGATSELLFYLCGALGVELTAGMASNLYAGILTDTGRFRYSNTTAQTMRVVAELMEAGADVKTITDQLYYDILPGDVLSMGKIFSSLELFGDGLVSTLFVRSENLVEDPDGIVDLSLSIRGVEVAAMFSETHDGKIRISLRSKHYVNVSDIAESFGGGGHTRAAGCRMRGTLDSARDRILPVVLEAVQSGANLSVEHQI